VLGEVQLATDQRSARGDHPAAAGVHHAGVEQLLLGTSGFGAGDDWNDWNFRGLEIW